MGIFFKWLDFICIEDFALLVIEITVCRFNE